MPKPGPDKALCGAQRPNQPKGVTCRQVAGARTDHLGVGHCWRHGGCTPTHEAAAQAEIIDRQARKLLEVEGFEPVTDPLSQLALVAGEIVKVKDVLLAKVEELTDLKTFLSGGEKGSDSEQIDVVFAAYERALDRAERVLTNMGRMDLEERIARVQSRIDELASNRIVAALDGALKGVKLSAKARQAVLSDFADRLQGDGPTGQRPALSA